MSGTWQAGWLTGDIVTAAEFKKSAGSIFDTTLGGTAAFIDITGISGTYAHLLVTIYARGDNASTVTNIQMYFNGDSSAIYDYQSLSGQAATPGAAETFGGNAVAVGSMPASTAGANLFGAAEVFIPNYAGSSNNKQFVSINSNKFGTSTGNMVANVLGGGWRSTAAINRLTFLPAAGNFVAGTRITVHALGA